MRMLLFSILWIAALVNTAAQDRKAIEKIRAKYDQGKYYAGIRLSDKLIGDGGGSDVLLLRAEGYNEIGEFARAERDARAVLGNGSDQDRKKAALQLGIAAMETGRADSARYWLNEAIGAADDREALIRLGRSDVVQGDLQAAMEKFNQLLSRSPDDAAALLERGAAHAMLGNTAAARSDLDRAIELAPRDPVAWNSRGFHLHAANDQHERAIKDYGQAIKFDPNYSFAFNNRGWSYFKLGDLKKARKNIGIAARKRPNNPFIHRNLGMIELQQGDTAKACSEFRKALDLNFTELHGSEVMELVTKHCSGAGKPIEKVPAARSNAPAEPTRTSPRSNAP